MSDFYKGYYEDHCFAHYGILGQKWGIRRYQNPDGSLTAEGKIRARNGEAKYVRREGERKAERAREGSKDAANVINKTGKTAGAIGAGLAGASHSLSSGLAGAVATSAANSSAPLLQLAEFALGYGAVENIAGWGTVAASTVLGGVAGSALVGVGTAAIGHLIKKHGEKKAENLEDKYDKLADAMEKEFSSDDEDRKNQNRS